MKLLQGNPGKRPINKNEPQPAKAGLEPPKWLSPDAKKVWRQYAPKLQDLGLLTELDVEFFALGCVQLVAARAGNDKAVQEVQRILAQFGFSPSARAKLTVSKPTDDPFEDFIKKASK